jgi:hypothetical protein
MDAQQVWTLMNSFRSLLIASYVIAIVGVAIPFVTAPSGMDAAIRISLLLSVTWVVVVVLAFAKFRCRALWSLLGAPLTGYWLFVLYLIASGCAHNVKNCP